MLDLTEQNLSPQTIPHTYVIVSEAMRLAVARGRIVRNPGVEVEVPKITKPEHR